MVEGRAAYVIKGMQRGLHGRAWKDVVKGILEDGLD